ncbi:MAG TPA: hypothetical protein VL978_16085, partial [Puia sp.]|nr:hypothetical protein [Puia sp.]
MILVRFGPPDKGRWKEAECCMESNQYNAITTPIEIDLEKNSPIRIIGINESSKTTLPVRFLHRREEARRPPRAG